jgi:hypothetical protein
MASRAKLVDRTTKGAVTTGVGVSCPSCGRFQVTSGTYRKWRNPPKYVRTGPGERGDVTVGHFLTRTDRYAKMLSRTRFGLGEGLFASFAQRYDILLGGRHKITSLQDLNLRLAAILVLHHAAAHDWATNHYTS